MKEGQNLGVSTHEKYSETNIYRDYKAQVEGEPYITAEFNYGTIKFRIGDGKYYSRSVQRQRQQIGETYLSPTTRLQKQKENMGFATLELNERTQKSKWQRIILDLIEKCLPQSRPVVLLLLRC